VKLAACSGFDFDRISSANPMFAGPRRKFTTLASALEGNEADNRHATGDPPPYAGGCENQEMF
jgi:hypothetical protein